MTNTNLTSPRWGIGFALAVVGLAITILALFFSVSAISFSLLVKVLFILAFLAILL